MLVIDEVHNLRVADNGTIKPSSENLLTLVSSTVNMKLLLLSATPMFNDYLEIIWLLNILNLNDKRYPITIREIFDSKGNFQQNKRGEEIGKELLVQKMIGYISYVRGNNPFTFPYGIYPREAMNNDSLLTLLNDDIWTYPTTQLNGAAIVEPINILDLTMTVIGDYQHQGYNFVLDSLRKRYKTLNDPNKGLSYTILEPPLQALNMIYPHIDMGNEDEDGDLYTYMYGKKGLERSMRFDIRTKRDFSYKDTTLKNFGRILSPTEIGKYSGKIAYICQKIRESEGIIFIYSQYIDGGAVPMALALEEMGITRHGNVGSLFKSPPVPAIDALTLEPASKSNSVANPAKYIMITGDKTLTPDVKIDLKAITAADNVHGEKVKVVIVSRAGSEGLDFKNIRQTHLLDPWYNLNRSDQIIGRSIRNKSHCALPFEERNVEIYLYGTRLNTTVEAADMYIYRLAENKAKKIAVITRILKENAVDCLLNRIGLDFSTQAINKSVQQKLSTGKTITYQIGDKDGSQACDFTVCNYKCNSKVQLISNVDTTSYNESFIIMNLDKILQRIRIIYKEFYIFERSELIKMLTRVKNYPLDQIYSALNYLVNEKNEYITDMLGRLGNLVNIGDFYMFQPVELVDPHISSFEREHPIDYKRESLTFNLPENIPNYSAAIIEETKASKLTSTSFSLLQTIYEQLSKPEYVLASDKENWTKTAAWAIANLHKYNMISMDTLLQLSMHHVIDAMNYNDKLTMLKIIYHKDSLTPIEAIVKSYFEKFIIKSGAWTGIVLADFSKPSTDNKFTILTYDNNRWLSNKRSIREGLGSAMYTKFLIKDISIFNPIIGFMTDNKRVDIVFKIKNLALSAKNRKNKGQRCSRGQGKDTLTSRINNLLGGGVNPIKYILKGRGIYSIYGNTDISQISFNPTRNRKSNVNISNFQLCIETELILRYYDASGRNNKRWFFNAVDAIINDIVEKNI